jgi:23S rRNA (pseudouridine1915-N3)-methyltransferase
MMRVTLAAVGKLKAGTEQDLLRQYLTRLPWPVTIHEVEAKASLPVDKRREAEAELLLAKCSGAHKLIALDERGKSFTSEQFATQIANWQQQGHSHLAFVIGGADGFAESFRKRADLLLAFGTMTWPHMLMRALLAEQLYRTHTILTGHPYHRA